MKLHGSTKIACKAEVFLDVSVWFLQNVLWKLDTWVPNSTNLCLWPLSRKKNKTLIARIIARIFLTCCLIQIVRADTYGLGLSWDYQLQWSSEEWWCGRCCLRWEPLSLLQIPISSMISIRSSISTINAVHILSSSYSYGFPIIFLWFSSIFIYIYIVRFFLGVPIIFLWVFLGFPIICLDFPRFSLWFVPSPRSQVELKRWPRSCRRRPLGKRRGVYILLRHRS